MSEKCPSCGSDFDFRSSRAMPGWEGGWPYNQFKCYSVLDDNGFHQSERCKISELEAENERLKRTVAFMEAEYLAAHGGSWGVCKYQAEVATLRAENERLWEQANQTCRNMLAVDREARAIQLRAEQAERERDKQFNANAEYLKLLDEANAENIGWRTKCAAQEQDIQDVKLDVAAAREGHRFCNEAMLSAEARERELREACQAAIDLLTDMRTTIECYGDDLIAEQVIDQLKAAAPAEKDKP